MVNVGGLQFLHETLVSESAEGVNQFLCDSAPGILRSCLLQPLVVDMRICRLIQVSIADNCWWFDVGWFDVGELRKQQMLGLLWMSDLYRSIL